jgi:hypothetical protein
MQRIDGMPDIKIVTVTLDNETGEIEIDYDVSSYADGWAIYGMLHGAIAIVEEYLVPRENVEDSGDDEDDDI